MKEYAECQSCGKKYDKPIWKEFCDLCYAKINGRKIYTECEVCGEKYDEPSTWQSKCKKCYRKEKRKEYEVSALRKCPRCKTKLYWNDGYQYCDTCDESNRWQEWVIIKCELNPTPANIRKLKQLEKEDDARARLARDMLRSRGIAIRKKEFVRKSGGIYAIMSMNEDQLKEWSKKHDEYVYGKEGKNDEEK